MKTAECDRVRRSTRLLECWLGDANTCFCLYTAADECKAHGGGRLPAAAAGPRLAEDAEEGRGDGEAQQHRGAAPPRPSPAGAARRRLATPLARHRLSLPAGAAQQPRNVQRVEVGRKVAQLDPKDAYSRVFRAALRAAALQPRSSDLATAERAPSSANSYCSAASSSAVHSPDPSAHAPTEGGYGERWERWGGMGRDG